MLVWQARTRVRARRAPSRRPADWLVRRRVWTPHQLFSQKQKNKHTTIFSQRASFPKFAAFVTLVSTYHKPKLWSSQISVRTRGCESRSRRSRRAVVRRLLPPRMGLMGRCIYTLATAAKMSQQCQNFLRFRLDLGWV